MFENELKIYNRALEQYRIELADDHRAGVVENFNSLFSAILGIHKVENNYIYLIATDTLHKFKLEKFYLNRLNELVKKESNNAYGVRFITADDARHDKPKQNPNVTPDVINVDKTKRLLRSEFTFENFVVGESNRFAYSEAMQVANSPYATFNPLYIMGPSGLGKTHLMMAIGHYILDNDINANVVYTSANQLSDDYFKATRSNKAEDLIKFDNHYQSADILLVDDIQLLENRERTQEEFFKFFDYLHEHNKQIVVTSDRPANELKIMARLKSRFTWGEVVEVKPPELALRVNILKRKLKLMVSNPKDVDEEVLLELASIFKDNVRVLEGALRTYINYCVSFGYPFKKEYIAEAIGNSIPKETSNIQTEEIRKLKKVICEYFRISMDDLESKSRKSNLVYARNLAFFILREDYKLQLRDIGYIFGGRDHTTIAHGCEKVKMDLVTSTPVISDVKYIRKKLKE